jgi:hypothetical protein
MTDNEIIKALKCCMSEKEICSKCPLGDECRNSCFWDVKASYTLDLINRQKAEIDNLEYTLIGVMHFVDKWLDGDELEQDEVNRAGIMREKTLKIVEKQQAEIDRLSNERIIHRKIIDDRAKAIIEHDAVIRDLHKQLKDAKSEAIKEFAETFLEIVQNNHYLLVSQNNSKDYGMFTIGIEQAVNETIKEMVGENNGKDI